MHIHSQSNENEVINDRKSVQNLKKSKIQRRTMKGENSETRFVETQRIIEIVMVHLTL